MTKLTNPRVLYVEDNDDCCLMVEFLLESSDIDVTLVKSASEALRLAATEHFDLYLLDSILPDQSGLELCSCLRARAPQTPILFYSGLAYASDIQNGLGAGANGYLVKPYGGDLAQTILETIQNFDVFDSEAGKEPSLNDCDHLKPYVLADDLYIIRNQRIPK